MGFASSGVTGADIQAAIIGLMPEFILNLLKAEFLTYICYGTATNPTELNDGNTASATPSTLNQYYEIDFKEYRYIEKHRNFGHGDNNGDGTFKIEYNKAGRWIEFCSSFSTVATAVWSGDVTETKVITDKIRITNTGEDTGVGGSLIGEFEIWCDT